MDKLLFLDTRNGRYFVGSTLTDLVLSTGVVTFDTQSRRAVIYGKPDTVSFSDEYAHDELIRAMARRTRTVLTNHYGFQLFRNDAI